MISPTHDWPERLRRAVVPKLGVLVAWYNETTGSDLYVEGYTTKNQFVGRVPKDENAVEKDLEHMGFETNLPASLKVHRPTGETEEGSYRWLGSNNAPWTEDYDDRKQLHFILYDGKMIPDAETGETYIYAHWEYRWDTDPVKHYRAVDWDAEKGVEMGRQMLDHYGIDYDLQRPPRKQDDD